MNRKKLRQCIVKSNGEILTGCYFHQWVNKSDIIEPSIMVGGHKGGVTHYCVALYETSDGAVHECLPSKITFVDNI